MDDHSRWAPVRELSAFVRNKCRKCPEAWIREGENDKILIVCTLDFESVWSKMLSCNKFDDEDGRTPQQL